MEKETRTSDGRMSVSKRLGTERFWKGEKKWIGDVEQRICGGFGGFVFSKGRKCVTMHIKQLDKLE